MNDFDKNNVTYFEDIDDSQEKLHLRLSLMWKRKTEEIPLTKKEIEELLLISLILYTFIATGDLWIYRPIINRF